MGSVDQESKSQLNEQFSLLVSCMNTIKVLTVLAEVEASPKEIGQKLGLKTPTASHHVKKLERLDLAELVEEREVGGTIQHFYRAKTRPLVDSEEWKKLSVTERERYSLWIMQLILVDCSRSFAAHLFDIHDDNHLSRTPLVADREGLTEVAKIMDRALSEILESQGRISERVARTGAPTMNIIAAMMCFEHPGVSDGLHRLHEESHAPYEPPFDGHTS